MGHKSLLGEPEHLVVHIAALNLWLAWNLRLNETSG